MELCQRCLLSENQRWDVCSRVIAQAGPTSLPGPSHLTRDPHCHHFICSPLAVPCCHPGTHPSTLTGSRQTGVRIRLGSSRRISEPPVRAEDVTQRRNWIQALAFAPSPRRERGEGSDWELAPSPLALRLVGRSPQAGTAGCTRRLMHRGERYLPRSPCPRQCCRRTVTISKLRIEFI